MMELRDRILILLEERRQAGTSGMPKIGDIAEGLGERLRDVVTVLYSSEAIGLLAIHRYPGEDEKDLAVTLKPAAYIHLESQLRQSRSLEGGTDR